MEQISTQSSILKPSFKKINLINKHWHLSTLIKQVCGSGLLFPKVSISQDSRIIYWDATYRGAFPSSLFSNNDNKLQRDTKNSFFKADVHGRFTACSRNKLLISKKKMFPIQGLWSTKMALINFCQLFLKTPVALRMHVSHLRFLKIAFHSCKSPSLRFSVHQMCTYPRDM